MFKFITSAFILTIYEQQEEETLKKVHPLQPTHIMTQRSQVPKFGDWDNQEEVPYTVYFEKAKKTRKSKMNPQISDPPSNNQTFQTAEEAQIRYGELTKSELERPNVKDSLTTKHETRVSREEVDLRKSNDSSLQPRRVSRPSGGSVQSFDNSPMHPRHQARGGNRGSVSSESSYGAGSSTPGRARLGQVTRGDENADDGTAIPKFGDWDDNDPASGERYTEVFNKARQDKHAAGGKSPMITSENGNFFGQRKEKSKVFGCFPWSKK